MNIRFLLATGLLSWIVATGLYGQSQTGKPRLLPGNQTRPAVIQKPVKPDLATPPSTLSLPEAGYSAFHALPPLHKRIREQPTMEIELAENGMPLVIRGVPSTYQDGKTLEKQCEDYLLALQSTLGIADAPASFRIVSITRDETGNDHIRMQQHYLGVRVYGGEIVLHSHDGIVDRFNGRYYPDPPLTSILPSIAEPAGREILRTDLIQKDLWNEIPASQLFLVGGAQWRSELIVYHPEENRQHPVLTWHFTVYASIMSRWEYFMDAQTGEILHVFESLCLASHHHPAAEKVTPPPPGPTTAVVQDLQNIPRTLNVYEVGGEYYMEDASRSMFNGVQSSMPQSPVGAIVTLNAQNTSPANNNFNYVIVSDNDNNWGTSLDTKKACSAHYNAGQAYTYFKNTFNRESINGSGGNIISLINVADQNGGDMDNAFWNGEAMFYGNGDQAFTPLAEALDVGGHEMSHGVVEKTANLEYQGESGALNESFADIFGAMIDRDDWKMGEDITNTAFFPTGALRDLSNPHNGGNDLNDNGWQPNHVNEQYTGSQDNGGVHINSGITNYAYYLFANNASVGKEKAEQVFYKALRDYLVMSSKFIDLRASVLSAIDDLNYSQAVTDAANSAFSQVGIGGGGSSGGAVYQQNLPVNPGDEYLLYTDISGSGLWISNTDGSNEILITDTNIRSKPSITDNGSEIVFIGADNRMYYITLNWQSGAIDEFIIQDQPIWRNAVFSKDGWKLAATFDDLADEIWVFSFASQTDQTFQLYNPTTAEGIETGEVQYADAMEWDHAGEYVMYDAFNLLNAASGADISYWDIGFLRAWRNSNNQFGDGYIDKLFSGLPENTSVGNPAFAKNSPYIIAFDFIDQFTNEYAVYGANLETGNVGVIFENNQLGYPNYSNTDQTVIFNAEDTNGDAVIGGRNVQSNKITGTGNAFGLVYGYWGTWFANGTRNLLLGTQPSNAPEYTWQCYPNPIADQVHIEFNAPAQEIISYTLADPTGKGIMSGTWHVQQGANLMTLDGRRLVSGVYFLQLQTSGGPLICKVMKP